MRRIIGTIGATLAVIVAIAVVAASQHTGGVNSSMGDGSVRFVSDTLAANAGWQVQILPYIEQENVYRLSGADYATVTSMMGDRESDWFEDYENADELDEDFGAATAVRTSSTWRALGTYNGGEVIAQD
jgi:prepilin-type processing-associated H-X9-DG protein